MPNEKTASEVSHSNYEREQLLEGIARGIATDFTKLCEEMVSIFIIGSLPMEQTPQDASEQFDRLERNGVKLNLVTGQYERKTR